MIIRDLYGSIFLNDIILRNRISNEFIFNRIAQFIFENIGKTTSFKKITDTLNSFGYKTANTTVEHYIESIQKAYCLYHCPRFDVNGKHLLKTNGKFYTVDFGLRNYIIPQKGINRGFILENVVFLELLKKGYKVYTGKVGRDYEIDFVAQKGNEILYVQVAESILDPETRKREGRVFELIGGKHRKIIVSLDLHDFESDNYDHFSIFDFINVI